VVLAHLAKAMRVVVLHPARPITPQAVVGVRGLLVGFLLLLLRLLAA
jgi:hypothetical protein